MWCGGERVGEVAQREQKQIPTDQEGSAEIDPMRTVSFLDCAKNNGVYGKNPAMYKLKM